MTLYSLLVRMRHVGRYATWRMSLLCIKGRNSSAANATSAPTFTNVITNQDESSKFGECWIHFHISIQVFWDGFWIIWDFIIILKVFFGLLFVLVVVALVAEADERQKRSPILGLLLAKKLLHGGGKNKY